MRETFSIPVLEISFPERTGLVWELSSENTISRHLMHDSKVVFRFEFERLEEILRDYITERESKKPNFMQGDFVPFAFEKARIGDTKPVELQSDFSLRGKIDRLDLDESSRAMYLHRFTKSDSCDEKQLFSCIQSLRTGSFKRKDTMLQAGFSRH